jgi:Ca-activated chloride channel family protein
MDHFFIKKICIIIVCPMLLFAKTAIGAEDPDLLYEQGKFAEAQKAYTELDMDNPRDTRYRYNKGCAAFQNSDFDSAASAFSSVLRRAEDEHTLFKSAYNLGNIAFKQGDFGTAIEYFKKAIQYMPENIDARCNIELALREKKKQEEQQQEEQPKDESGDEQKEESGDSKEQDQSESEKSQSEEQSDTQEQEQGSDQQQKGREDEGEQSPEDLSGELEGSPEMPELNQEEMQEQMAASLDEKKAEALLDNLQEDRSRFMQFQIPEDKRKGVGSGKDW